jgi:hypothetical protein
MLVAGAGVAGATNSWDSFAGGLTGAIMGSVVGAGFLNANKNQFSNFRSGYGFKLDRDIRLDKAFAAKQYALQTGYSEDIGIVETYYRKLDINIVRDVAGRVHPFMRDTWSGGFHELEAINGQISFLEGDIGSISKSSQAYWTSFPRPDRIDYVSMPRFYEGIARYKSEYAGLPYSVNIFNHMHDCQGARDYIMGHSSIIYGKKSNYN